mgnify:CR=1 FL=1
MWQPFHEVLQPSFMESVPLNNVRLFHGVPFGRNGLEGSPVAELFGLVLSDQDSSALWSRTKPVCKVREFRGTFQILSGKKKNVYTSPYQLPFIYVSFAVHPPFILRSTFVDSLVFLRKPIGDVSN